MKLPLTFPTKLVAEVRDYGIDWSKDLAETATTITASNWSSTPAGLTLGTAVFTNTTTAVRISSGTSGVTYKVTNTVTLSSGETGVTEVNLYVG